MGFQYFAGAAFRALTAHKDGPSLYDVCDPAAAEAIPAATRISASSTGPRSATRRCGRCCGGPGCRRCGTRAGSTACARPLRRARDEAEPDWAAVGAPVAELMDGIGVRHPQPAAAPAPSRAPAMGEIENTIRVCAKHLLRSYSKNGFIPTYAAFNLLGDPDMGGREMLMALTGLNSRGYKNSTLLFSLARIFIAHSPARALINPPWTGIAEPMWEPMQIKHRSAYYDAFFTEALLSFVETGLASTEQAGASRRAIDDMVDFCLRISREEVASLDGSTVNVVTALAPLPHPRFSRFFAQIKQDLGFGVYVPDCDTTACSFSAATQAGSNDPMLDQPLLDFYSGLQVRAGANEPRVTVPLNDNIDYEGGVVTWIDSLAGERPFGNDLDPTLNLDILEVSFRNLARWKVLETPSRLATVHRIIGFQRKLVESGAFANPRSHIYYLPELYCAYFGRCYAAFLTLPAAARRAIDPDGTFEFIRPRVLAYVQTELIAHEMNPFDAALALMALAHLGADAATFTPALHCIVKNLGEGGRHGPYKAYEWNKMKTPTRILVGGPEVTSAFVLMALALARRVMKQRS